MNIFIELCREKLQFILKMEIGYNLHKCFVLDSIHNCLDEATEVVICGLSPIGKLCFDNIQQFTNAEVSVLDIRNEQDTTVNLGDYGAFDAEKSAYLLFVREKMHLSILIFCRKFAAR